MTTPGKPRGPYRKGIERREQIPGRTGRPFRCRARGLDDQYTELRLRLLARKRAAIIRLRDERRIDDIVLRQGQAKLDIERSASPTKS